MWNPEIRICPVKRLYQLIAVGEAGSCGALISSSTDIDVARLGKIPYVFRRYEDIDMEVPGRSFSREDAAAFARFLRSVENQVEILYCCCDAGESRSPAVAAAVSRALGLSDEAIWSNPHYHPNMLVFDELTAAFGLRISDGEKDALMYLNAMAFKKAIGKM